jgi:hypothetical protein
MFQARRPKTPKGFNLSVRDARKRIRELVGRGERPTSKDFDDTWSRFKHLLAEAQHHRCGYCDRKVLGGDDGTVDHYRPKSDVEELEDDPDTWGRQRAHSASIEGRKSLLMSERGYHWLAYTWHNYVFACSCCNEKWKRAIFPVATHPRCCPPRPRSHEEPLLLSCYGPLRPSEHLQFNEDGTVEARNGSRYGHETIRTVGLHREPLRDEREDVTRDVYEALRELAEGTEGAVRALCRLGGEGRSFSGVARAVVEQELEMSWDEFVATFTAI